jgi:hypothetical protein
LVQEGEADSRVATDLLSALAIAVPMIALPFGARGTLPWLVAEPLGTDAGMSLPQVGNLFSLMYAVSILGPVALLFLARVAGVRAILFWSLAVAGFFNWLFTVPAGNTVKFSVGIIVWATIYFIAFAQSMLSLPWLTGRASSSRRWAVPLLPVSPSPRLWVGLWSTQEAIHGLVQLRSY